MERLRIFINQKPHIKQKTVVLPKLYIFKATTIKIPASFFLQELTGWFYNSDGNERGSE